MNNVSKLTSVIENNVHCPVCFEIFINPQALIPCLHTLCKTCVKSLTVNNKLTCPTCRKVTECSAIVPDFKTNEQVEIYAKVKNESKSRKRKIEADDEVAFNASKKCDLCEENSAACFCNGCSRYVCKLCCKSHLKLSTCTLENSEPIEVKLPKLSESLTKTTQELETASQQLLEAKNDYVKLVKDNSKQCVNDLKEWKQQIVKKATATFNQLKDSVVKIEKQAIAAAVVEYGSIRLVVDKNVSDAGEVKPHVLMTTHDAFQQKLQQSLVQVKSKRFLPFQLEVEKEDKSNAVSIIPKLELKSDGIFVAIPEKGTIRHTFTNITQMTLTPLTDSSSSKIGGLSWFVSIAPYFNKANAKFLSLYLQCRSEEKPNWQATVSAKIELISQKPEQNGFGINLLYYRSYSQQSSRNGWGKNEIIKWEELMNPNRGLVINNSLIVEATIETFLPNSVFVGNNNTVEKK